MGEGGMFTRRNRDLLPQKTELTPFAAKARDLGALRDAVVDAASVGTGLWISYLFALFYFGIAAGAVTHRDLLLENAVKLPFLNVELSLRAFFVLGPLVFLIVQPMCYCTSYFLPAKSALLIPNCKRRSLLRMQRRGCAPNCRATSSYDFLLARRRREPGSLALCCG
jgi:hypothetical protein